MKKYFFLVIPVLIFSLYLIFTQVIFPANLAEISEHQNVDTVSHKLLSTPALYPYQPAFLFVQGFLVQEKAIFLLLVEAVLTFSIFLLIAKRKTLYLWKLAYEDDYNVTDTGHPQKPPFYGLNINTRARANTISELLSIYRNPYAFGYLLFILSLFFVLIFFLGKAGVVSQDYFWMEKLIISASFLSISYIFLLFDIRYVYPSFSFTEKNIWSSITSASKRKQTFVFKWRFYLVLSVLLTLILAIVVISNNQIIQSTAGIFFTFILLSAVVLAIISLFTGSICHKPIGESEAEKLATTVAGLVVTITSILSVAFLTMAMLQPINIPISIIFFLLLILITDKLYKLAQNKYLADDLG